MSKLIDQFAKAIRDPDVSHASRLHWAEHVFEGYRDYVCGRGCPYSHGSSRATAWNDGRKIAVDDGVVPAKSVEARQVPNVHRAPNGTPLCSEVEDLAVSGWCDACIDDHGTCVGSE